jgi:hypothetical protein
LSIAAPTGAEYNGVSGHAIEEGGTMTADAKKAAMYTVTYTYKEKESDTPEDTIKTIDAGYYEATLTLHAADLSLTTSYQVAKATLYIAANDNTIVYGNDGANAGVTVTGLLGNDSAEVRVRTDSDKTDVSGANITAVISFTYLTDSGATYQAGDGVGVNYSIVPAIDTTLSYAKNYNFDYYTTADDAHAYYGVLTVKQRSLYITSISADDKFYDGTTWAQLYVTLRDGDLLEKDKDLVTINVTGAFTTKDVEVNSDGTPKAKTVKMTGATLQGATANIQNYVIAGLKDDALNAAGKTSATIKPVAINVDGIIAIDKVYDGTKTTYYSANNARFSGDKYITSDNVTIADIKTVEFDSADVAYVDGVIVAKTVTFSNFVLGGNDGINYYIEGSLQSTAKITPISITIEGVTAYNKIYDGTTVATIDFTNAKVSGVLSQDGVLDDVKVNDAKGTAAFKTASQGTGKTVEISGLEITGAKAGNYTYNYDTIIVTSADISRRVIYVNGGITASGKEYDKTTDVDVYDFSNATFAVLDKDGNVITDLPEAIANDINGSDRITIMASLEFTSANAGENVPINVTIVELLGTNADNYTLLDRTYHAPDGLSATITKRVVIAGNVLVDDKDYDKNTTATPIYESLEFTRPQGYSGKAVMDGDILTVNATAEFDTPNAGDDIPVHITIVGLAGEAADNYMLDPNTTEHADAYASIRPIGITVSGGIVATERVYNGGTDVLENVDVSGAQFTGVKDGDEVKIDKFTAHMKDKNVGEAKDVDIVFLSLAGADAGNYYLADDDYEGALTIKITHVTITMTGEGIIAMDKVHDGTTAAEIEVQNAKFDGVLDGDLIGVTIRGEFESSDANDEEAQSITITRALLTGQDAGNYILDESALRAEGESVGYTAPKAFIFKREIAGPSSAEYSITLTYNGEYRTSTELAKLTGVERSEGQLNEASEFVAGETDNVVKNAGTYTIRLTLQDPVNTRWADGVNATGVNDNIGSYIDFTVIVNPLLITKPTADTSEFVYNGVEQTYNVQGNAEESKWYTVTGNKQTSGTHEVTVELNDPGNVMWDDGTTAAITFEFVITGDPASPIFWLEILIGAGILFELFWMITLIASKNKNKKNGTTNAIAPLPLLAVGALLATIPNWEFWLILVLAVVLIVLLVVLVISTQIYFKNRRQAKDGDRIESEGVSYELTDGEYYSVDGIGTCSQTELVISAYVDGVPVKRIKAGAFSNCMQLTKLYVPSTIEEIGVGAFEGCDNLMDATFSRQGGGKWTVSLDGSKGKNITSKLKKNGHAAKLLTLDLAKYYWIKK